MAFSTEYSNKILKGVFAVEAFSGPSEVWVGLTTEENGGAEITGEGYTRIIISKRNSSVPDVLGDINNGMVQNKEQINWNKATNNWTTAKGFALYESKTASAPFFTGKLEQPVTVEAGDVALFDPNTLQISFSG